MTSNTRTLNDADLVSVGALARLHDRAAGNSTVGHTLTRTTLVAIELENQGGAQ